MEDKIPDAPKAETDTDATQAPPPPILPPSIKGNKDGEGDNAHKGGKDVTKKEDEPPHWTRYVEAGCAIALVLITGTYTWYASTQAGASVTAADAARDAANVASQTLCETRKSNTKQFAAAEQARIDSNIASEASRKASDRALEATIESARFDRRAWLGTPYATVIQADETKPLSEFKAEVLFRNTGRTPALHVQTCNFIKLSPTESTTTLNDIAMLKDKGKCTQGYFSMAPDAPYIYKVSDGGSYVMPIWSRITSGKHFIYLYGRIEYRDVAKKPHVTTFCFTLGDPTSKVMTGCKDYNDMN